ncbi:MAG: SulP family inorganic anion transporter, partial [Planctomycetaceae bacterium]
MSAESPQSKNVSFGGELLKNLVAGLTVSFVAISLGAAFGILSTRGAFAGILSAGIIALITAVFGGTRIQTSGPTAPMTAVTVVLIAFATSSGVYTGNGLNEALPGVDSEQFVNLVFVLTGVLLVAAAVLRLGKFIQLVPKTVISGFMNGIAILIWMDQAKKLFGFGGQQRFAGSLSLNLMVALTALALAFLTPMLVGRLFPRIKSFLPGTLVAVLVATIAAQAADFDIEMVKTVKIENTIDAWSQVVTKNWPSNWDLNMVWLALPFAIELMLLCYLDTLLTSLVVDKKMTDQFGSEERTNQNQELAAQGVANAAVSLVGGIPGAQATIRSVLILNEGATWRLAGAAVGVFVLLEMLIFQDYIGAIPVAVFVGILFKVGYDVFDWEPVVTYVRQ